MFAENPDIATDTESVQIMRADMLGNMRVSSRPPIDVDAWDLDLDALDTEHMLVTSHSHTDTRPRSHDLGHEMAANWHLGGSLVQASASKNETESQAGKNKPRASLLAWMLMLAGIMAFACGAVLMGMSIIQARSELWRMGLPLALVGQAGLVVGLILQLERYWQCHRKASKKLSEVDEQVADLQVTTGLLGSTHSGPSQAFYHHMANGANTELMLADLKGQMDMLAAQMTHRGRR